ncbi:hypothetical protein EV401DRAFT_524088 [Pisolithus croceorrhizus]|nr:hypothetical protein EV401DRAFT_524088 [Pisolithus croceorrhizus]
MCTCRNGPLPTCVIARPFHFIRCCKLLIALGVLTLCPFFRCQAAPCRCGVSVIHQAPTTSCATQEQPYGTAYEIDLRSR